MSILETIVDKTDVEQLLTEFEFNHIKQDGNMIRSCCKLHDGNNPTAFVINPETGLWYCHTGNCGGGDLFTMVQQLKGLDFVNAVKWLAAYSHVDIDGETILERKENYVKEMINFIKLMRQRKEKVHFPPFYLSEPIAAVKSFRDFKPETLHYFQLGYVGSITLKRNDGTPFTLQRRLVFPIVQDGVQVGVSLRRVKSGDNPKWMHQPHRISTGSLLYNYDTAREAKHIVVVEGITDVWAFHEIGVDAVATFGAHITNTQYKLLLQTGADITLAFDGDNAGWQATKRAVKQLQNKTTLSYIVFPPDKDSNNLSREELKKLYDGRKRT